MQHGKDWVYEFPEALREVIRGLTRGEERGRMVLIAYSLRYWGVRGPYVAHIPADWPRPSSFGIGVHVFGALSAGVVMEGLDKSDCRRCSIQAFALFGRGNGR